MQNSGILKPEALIRVGEAENNKLKHAVEVLVSRDTALQNEILMWRTRFLGAAMTLGGEIRVSRESLEDGEIEVSRKTDPATHDEVWMVKRKSKIEEA